MNQEMKLAVLIDAENISNKYIDVILSEANNLGNIVYKRIYGNWTTPLLGKILFSIMPSSRFNNTATLFVKIHPTRHSLLIQWIFFTKAIWMPIVSFHRIATSLVWLLV